MSVKVYVKRGAKNYKESKMIRKVQAAIEKKIEENPSFAAEFRPATNMSELQKLHDTYCVEDADFVDVPNSETPTEGNSNESYQQHKEFRDGMKKQMEESKPKEEVTSKAEGSTFEDENDSFIDPLNREEPIVRDYVTQDEFPNQEAGSNRPVKTSFDEPMSFKESFDMPEDGNPSNPRVSGAEGQNQQKQASSKQAGGNQKPATQPMNPNWDDMNNGKKKKSTRKFAKYIVETVCMLAEKGFVWYANKDINEAKLAEYELNDQMDLTVMVTLEDGQQATVKDFFAVQCIQAERLAKIDPEEKSDLADALAEVLMEKGVGPTPTQELMLIAAKIFGGQAITLFAMKSQTNGVLNQLRAMKEAEKGGSSYTPPPTPPPAPEQKRQEPVRKAAPNPVSTPVQEQEDVTVFESFEQNVMSEEYKKMLEEEDAELGIIEKPIDTKE